MGARNKKKLKRLNLLEMPNHKRNQLIKEIREKLRKKTIEAKLWQSLLEVENLTVNGNTICREDETLAGLSFRR